MATVATFTIDAGAFPLGAVFEDLPGLHLELERIVPTNGAVVPYLWVRGGDRDILERNVRSHPELGAIDIVDEIDGELLVKLSWASENRGVLKAITETGVTLLSGHGRDGRWTFEVRGDDRSTVSEFQRYCREHDVPVELTAIHALSHPGSGAAYDLTGPQLDALVLAYERGYFESPRESSLEDIAAELGITGQSLGSRLRRGTNRLVRSTLVDAEESRDGRSGRG